MEESAKVVSMQDTTPEAQPLIPAADHANILNLLHQLRAELTARRVETATQRWLTGVVKMYPKP